MLKKKIVLALGLGLSFLLVAPAAFAAEGDLVNSDTGRDSTNKIEVETKNNTDVNIDNKAQIDNIITVTSNTGHNKVEDNGAGGKGDWENGEEDQAQPSSVVLNTGDATASANVTNNVNTAKVEVEKETKNENENEEEEENNNGGIGGGGSNVVAESGGVGGGVVESSSQGGIGGGTLPETGASPLSEISALAIALLGAIGSVFTFKGKAV